MMKINNNESYVDKINARLPIQKSQNSNYWPEDEDPTHVIWSKIFTL